MSIGSTTIETDPPATNDRNPSTSPQIPPTNAASTDGQNERKVLSGKSLAQLHQSSIMASASSAPCRRFIEDLYKECERLGLGIEGVITGTVDAQVVYHRESNYGIALIFAGSTGIARRPVSDKAEEVVSAFKTHPGMGGIRILLSMVVDETSYERAGIFAASIFNTIMTCVDEDNNFIDEASFLLGGRKVPLMVSTKPDAYRDYINRVSPFGFSERDDIGFLVGFPRENCPMTERFNVSPETHIVLFAVTGYTQFVRIENQMAYGTYSMNGQVPKTIRPIVHISSIVSQNPSMILLPPAVTIAARTFIAHRNWRKPYLMINGKESMNVGNLVLNVDPNTGARTTNDCETAFQAEEAINATCEEPILALDITQGRDGIPGMECIFGMRNGAGQDINLASVMQKFYPNSVNRSAHGMTVTAGEIHEYTGSVLLDNQIVDSRCADYLRMFRKIGDFGQVAILLSQPNDPSLRLQQLQDFSLPVKSLYNTTSAILSKDCVQFLKDLCPVYEIDLTNDARFNYAFNGVNAAAGISQMNLVVSDSGNNGIGGFVTPFSRW